MGIRIEKDSLGEFNVPDDRLYGAQTARAVDNFPISGQGIGRAMIRALGLIKFAAAKVNEGLGSIKPEIVAAICAAAQEVIDGKLDEHFPVDVFQTGSGTSSNMNANEVISNRAIQTLGGEVGSKSPVHPNDHVNFGQSSNDVFPTAIHVAAVEQVERQLLPALAKLHQALAKKAAQFDDIVKIGRTHLQDATPIRLGQEFGGYAAQVQHSIAYLRAALEPLRELPQGGTAVGTGINTHPDFGRLIALELSSLTGLNFREASNHVAAQSMPDGFLQISGALKHTAINLHKIANDIRFLGSGPRLGLGELVIPAVQPGSSIMPGKVNPVICESVIQVAAQVIGNDAAVAVGLQQGYFELNTMLPVIARNVLESATLLANVSLVFDTKCLASLTADREHIEGQNEQSLSLATALAPIVGYDAAAKIAKQSFASGQTVRQIAEAAAVLPKEQLDQALDLRRQTEPGIPK